MVVEGAAVGAFNGSDRLRGYMVLAPPTTADRDLATSIPRNDRSTICTSRST